jgi:CBS domain containing-hemolysin-like protein
MIEHDPRTIVACIGLTLAGLLLSLVLGAVALRAAAKRTADLNLPFWPSMGTVMVYSLADFGLALIVAMLVGMAESGPKQTLLQAAAIPTGLLFQSAIISGRHQVSLGKGLKISILMWLVILTIALVVAVPTLGLHRIRPHF